MIYTDVTERNRAMKAKADDRLTTDDGAAAESVSDRVFWGPGDSIRAQRSFIADMASRNAPYRPEW